jgi:hypothetical protein
LGTTTSPRPCSALHEVSSPFRQSLFAIVRGTARSNAPRMQRRPGTFRTRELSYRRLWAAALRIVGYQVHFLNVPFPDAEVMQATVPATTATTAVRLAMILLGPPKSLNSRYDVLNAARSKNAVHSASRVVPTRHLPDVLNRMSSEPDGQPSWRPLQVISVNLVHSDRTFCFASISGEIWAARSRPRTHRASSALASAKPTSPMIS